MTSLIVVLLAFSPLLQPSEYQAEPFGVQYQPPAFLVLSADAPGQPFGVRYESNFGYYMATLDRASGAQLAERDR